jgi:CO/xanthine dehydrogenase Mo-binding subunit
MAIPKASPEQPPLPRGRDDAARLVSGRNAYLADHIGPRHLHARLVRSYLAAGRLRGIDASTARQLPGVVAVLTAQDLAPDGVPTIPLRNPDPTVAGFEQPVLAHEVVRYVGEPVAVVIAEDAYQAEDAAEHVLLDLEPEDAVADVDAAATRPDPRGRDGVIVHLESESGDWQAAVDASDHVISGTFDVQRQTGLPLETRGVIAEWDDQSRLHLWGPTKYVHFTRRTLASQLAIPVEDVIVHGVDVGGMFGVRGEFYPEDFLIPWAARLLGRPVAWREDRREHLLTTNHSRQQRHEYELALTTDGRFLAYRDQVSVDAGAYIRPAGIRPLVMLSESIPGPYRWNSTHTRITSYATNKTPVGNMRGPSGTEATFVRERAIDQAAAELGMDPFELRRRNLLAQGELPTVIDLGPDLHGPTYDPEDYHRILDQACEAFDLDRARAEVAERRSQGERVGIGIGCFLEHTGNGLSETVGVEITIDGRLELRTGECDIGQGLTSMMHALSREHLAIEPDRVDVLSGDSRTFSEGKGTFGSRTAIFVGNALASVLTELGATARERAAERLGVAVADVQPSPAGFRAGEELLDWKELAPLALVGRFDMDEPTWGFGVHIAQVAVDGVTGQPQLERLLVAYDGGRLLDPTAAHDQLQGGSVYGAGGALFEELRYEPDGQPSVTTLAEYLLPAYSELPDVEVLALADQPAVGNPLGLRGVGEAGVLGVGAAIANAVADAVPELAGSLASLPIRAEELLGALTPSRKGVHG